MMSTSDRPSLGRLYWSSFLTSLHLEYGAGPVEDDGAGESMEPTVAVADVDRNSCCIFLPIRTDNFVARLFLRLK